jgi:ATP-dependent Clp protease ATP-binding subunit ClpA
LEAARRKFTPEFMNRLDKVVTFSPLGVEQLRQILDIELDGVQQRIFNVSAQRAFGFTATGSAKEFLLHEGTDTRYGARHLKRAIERLIVQPLSNLIATSQVRAGDWIRIDHDENCSGMAFLKEAEGLDLRTMTALSERAITPGCAAHAGVTHQRTKTQKVALIRRD